MRARRIVWLALASWQTAVKITLLLMSAVLIAVSAHPYNVQAQATPVALKIDTTRTLGAISPRVYGSNYGPWAIVPVSVIPLAEQSGITYLRYPGGNWGDQRDLASLDLDLLMLLARKLNPEINISVRLKGGTPQKAADLVHYVNIEQGYKVHYWSIGNEPDLYPNYTVEQYVKDWRAFAEAMLKVDPSIVLVGPDVSQFPPTVAGDTYNNVRREWVRAFLKADGDLVSVVSIHRYPFPTGQTAVATVDQLLQNSPEWDVLIANLRAVVKDATNRDLPIAITEANSYWAPTSNGEATPDSFANAIWWADVLARMIRNKVDTVAYFTLETPTDSFGMLAHDNARPTYYTYQLYKQFGSMLVESSSSDPEVSILSALRPDGTLTVMLINLSAEARTANVALTGFTGTQPGAVFRLDAQHNATNIGTQALSQPITLPSRSVTLLVVPTNP